MTQSIAELLQENRSLKQHIELLEEKLRLASLKRFAASSEKASDDQLGLFNEAEQTWSEAAESAPDDETASMAVSTRGSDVEQGKKKPGRKPMPEHLPRVVIEHDIAEADKQCACGAAKTKIGAETCEQLDIIPAKIQVLSHVRFKYACRSCVSVRQPDNSARASTTPGQQLVDPVDLVVGYAA